MTALGFEVSWIRPWVEHYQQQQYFTLTVPLNTYAIYFMNGYFLGQSDNWGSLAFQN